MASSITNAGTGSGNDFESIISALVASKTSQLNNRVTVRQAELEIEQTGVDTLSSALTSFRATALSLKGVDVLNTHKITTSQSSSYTAFTVEAQADCANTSMTVAVNQLASKESITQKFSSDTDEFNNSFSAGTLTISLGEDEDGNERSFDVEVSEGDTLAIIRKRINSASENTYGVSCNLLQTSSGYSFSISAGETGLDTQNISISVSSTDTDDHDSLSLLAFDRSTDLTTDDDGNSVSADSSNWSYTAGTNAIITVNGETIESESNTFDSQISGLTITVQNLSETETVDGVTEYKAYNVNVTSDYDAAAEKIESFVTAYNTLMETLDTLYARNTYTDGENNYDGGDLAGDSQVKAIKSTLQSMIVNSDASESGLTIFDCGLDYSKEGELSLDTDKLKEAIDSDLNGVEEIFTDYGGLFDKISSFVYEYTKYGGLLDQREQQITSEVEYWNEKETRNNELIEQYEASLRTKYGNLDSLMAGYQTSMSYLSSVISSTSTSSSSS